MSGVKGPGTQNLRRLNKRLMELPTKVAIETARSSAVSVTALAGQSYDAGQNVYGGARPSGVNGNQLDLVRTGQARGLMRFAADGGRWLRAVLNARDGRGRRYMHYLIGLYRILPIGAAAVPKSWKSAMEQNTATAARKHAKGLL